MKNFLVYLFAVAGAILLLTLFFSKEPGQNKQSSENTDQPVPPGKYSSPPPMSIDQSKSYSAEVVTNKGSFTIDLFAKEVPVAVNNFVFLSRENFYNGVIFHRIIKDFMVQTGDPKGDGTGGPGYKFDDESITRDYNRGIVAMANSGKDTNSSQFFIMTKDTDLPKNYVIFGQVSKGIETIDKIANVEVEKNSLGELSKPKEKVSINKITIFEK